jgi:phytoene synthase
MLLLTAPPGRPTAAPWPAGSFGLPAARRLCRALAVQRFGWLAWHLQMLGRAEREALEAIHAFAAQADDFVDEAPFEGQRERLLEGWARELEACFAGRPRHPVSVALSASVETFGLRPEPFEALLAGCLRDCRAPGFEDFGALRAHLDQAVVPLGRLLAQILGEREPDRLGRLDALSAGLQLTRYWQNLSLDVRRSRLYLPREDLERFEVSPRALALGLAPRGLGPLIRLEAQRTRELYQRASPLLSAGGALARVAAPAWLGGRGALRLVRQAGARLLERRLPLDGPRLTRAMLAAGWDRLTRRAA